MTANRGVDSFANIDWFHPPSIESIRFRDPGNPTKLTFPDRGSTNVMRRHQYVAVLLGVLLLLSLVKVPAIPVSYEGPDKHGSDGHNATLTATASGTSDSSDGIGATAMKVNPDGIERIVAVNGSRAVGQNNFFGWSLRAELTLENPTETERTYRVTVSVSGDDGHVARQERSVSVEAGETASVTLELNEVPYRSDWPQRYDITYTVNHDGETVREQAPFASYRQTLTVWEYLTG